MTTLFLLGGTGFIGREVVTEAVQRGYGVWALGRSETARSRLAEMGAAMRRLARPDAADRIAEELIALVA